jgi:hypothetical protein
MIQAEPKKDAPLYFHALSIDEEKPDEGNLTKAG